jgi:hypothetical protein
MVTRKDHPETGPEGQKAKADAVKADQATAKQVQERVDEETERGFRGVEVDPTPNDNYTVAGVTKGAPTPETDDKAAEEARKAQADASSKAAGVAEK